jgi:hypothetical protein
VYSASVLFDSNTCTTDAIAAASAAATAAATAHGNITTVCMYSAPVLFDNNTCTHKRTL